MADPFEPNPVKLIAGLLAQRAEMLDVACGLLREEFGPVDIVSPDWPFTFTHYYDAQMGTGLLRRFVAFETLIDPGALRAIKRRTNELELQLARQFTSAPRPVNLDPGYIAPSKLVLASAKDFSHRIYLGEGIYAEITLQYRDQGWQKLPWTFPDYGSGLYDEFLSAVRQKLREQFDCSKR